MRRLLIIAATVAFASPVLAADFSTTINYLDGKPMLQADKTPLTLEDVASTALLSAYQDEPNLTGVEKNKRFWLAKKIHDHPKDPVLTVDEISTIKQLIAKAYNPLVVGRAWGILDPASSPQ